MKLHKIPQSVSSEVCCIFCKTFRYFLQLYGLQQLHRSLQLHGSGHIMIILNEIVCEYVYLEIQYILEGLILLKAILLKFTANLDNFVANCSKSETKQCTALKLYR